MIVHFAVGLCRMHQDVSKILRSSVDISLDVVPLSDEGIALSSDVVDVTVDGCCCCCCSSCWLTFGDWLFSLAKFFVESS